MHFRSALALAVFLLAAVPGARAQDSLNVTFRFLPDLGGAPSAPVVQVFLPGGFTGGPTDWGAPYVAGVGGARIANNHPSKMAFDAGLTEFRKVQRLRIGSAYQYKVQFHTNATETSPNGFTWTADPLNPVVVGNDGNSGITVTDPLVFQLAREQEGTSTVSAVSAGIFGTQAITAGP